MLILGDQQKGSFEYAIKPAQIHFLFEAMHKFIPRGASCLLVSRCNTFDYFSINSTSESYSSSGSNMLSLLILLSILSFRYLSSD